MKESEAREAQAEEFQALTAILGEEISDLREKDAWKIWRPLELLIQLRPSEGPSGLGEAFVRVDLRLSCPALYPARPPTLALENSHGLSTGAVAELLSLLRGQAAEAAASTSPVVLELVQTAADWLHARNAAPALASLYDGHLRDQQDKERRLGQQAEAAAASEAAEIEAELARRRAILRGDVGPASPPIPAASPKTRSTSLPPQAKDIPRAAERPRLATISPSARATSQSTEDGPLAERQQWDSSSRLGSEFQILRWLGQGGFGDVVKVRNRLDGNLYAIKRIPLDPRSRALNRKITREVKLLSRLNHENVVRYYNSWLETGAVDSEAESSMESRTEAATSAEKADDSLDALAPTFRAPPADSREWSTSYGGQGGAAADAEESSSSDEDDDMGLFAAPRRVSPVDDSIVFQREGGQRSELCWASTSGSAAPPALSRQIMYIQMEFCAKETLRESIDRGETFGHPKRTWRLFREILEGLAYIHYQVCMIHRDVKPVNIFLDAGDHAKIGDFGLACTSDRKAAELTLTDQSSLDESGMTTEVGTALYVAPELAAGADSKTEYSHKVDIFSLGIVLFEMFYRPMRLGMERVSVLRGLRAPALTLPSDFDDVFTAHRLRDRIHKLVLWMLDHDPSKRASTSELLESTLVPADAAASEFGVAVSSALGDTQGRAYRVLLTRLFAPDRFPYTTQEYCFDQDLELFRGEFEPGRVRAIGAFLDRLSELFRRHGAVKISPPTLLPKSRLLRGLTGQSAVELLDTSGTLISLPWDLRIGFVRWVVRQQISRLKRFDIGPVFRPSIVPNSHPKETLECVYDVISTGSGLSGSVASGEVLATLEEVVLGVAAWPHAARLCLRVSHSRLLRALLAQAGIRERAAQNEVVAALEAAKGVAKEAARLLGEIPELPPLALSAVLAFTALHGTIDGVFSQLRTMTHSYRRQSGEEGIASILKDARVELEKVEKAGRSLGLSLPLLVDLSLVLRPAEYDSGLVFQLSTALPEKRRRRTGLWRGEELVLAGGGRYDGLISAMRVPAMEPQPPPPLSAVGFTLTLAPLLTGATGGSGLELLICSTGRETRILHEKLRLVRAAWAAGIRADFLHDPMERSLDALEEHCREAAIPFLLLVKGDESSSAHLLKRWTEAEERFQDLKVSGPEAIHIVESSRCESSVVTAGPSVSVGKQASVVATPLDETRGFSAPLCANAGNLKVTFLVCGGRRLSGHNRRVYEASIGAVLGGLLGKLSPRVVVEVLASDLRKDAIAALAAALNLRGPPTSFRAAFKEVQSGLPKPCRESLLLVEEALWDLAFRGGEPSLDASNSLVVLFATADDAFRVLS